MRGILMCVYFCGENSFLFPGYISTDKEFAWLKKTVDTLVMCAVGSHDDDLLVRVGRLSWV